MELDEFIVDSSFLVAFYRDIDSQHQEARRIASDLVGKTIILHPYVIQETATVLTYTCGTDIAYSFLADVAVAERIIIPPPDIQTDIKMFIALKRKISFTDASLIALAKQRGAQIITFDREILSLFK